jgi:hypothetical protein
MCNARLRNHSWCGKTKGVTYYVCVFVALFIQDAKRMRRVVLPSVASLALTIFLHIISQPHLEEK